MTDKEQFDGFMRLAELRTLRATNRQTYEWKVTFGFWAVITAATLYPKGITVPLWVGIGIFLVYAFFWLRAIFVAHERDNRTAAYYIEKAISVLTPGHELRFWDCRKEMSWLRWLFGFLAEWGCVFQLLTTAILIYFFYLTTSPAVLPWFLRAS